MRKRNIITAIFLVIVVVSGIAYYNYQQQPDGLTIESRELIMAEHKNPPRCQNWKIANETNIDNFVNYLNPTDIEVEETLYALFLAE